MSYRRKFVLAESSLSPDDANYRGVAFAYSFEFPQVQKINELVCLLA